MRNIVTIPVDRVVDGCAVRSQDLLAVEEPLEIRIGDRPISITMRTPANDSELAAGFLFTEGIIESSDAIERVSEAGNSVTVTLKPAVDVQLERFARHFYMSSSCGLCGKASLQALEAQGCRMLPREGPEFPAALIPELPDRLRAAQAVFEHTGGLHAAGLFDGTGRLLAIREDVGRHNATDKLIGTELLGGRVPLSDHLLLVSGRASFELVQKALMAGIPILAAVGAPSSLAVQAAHRYNMTLIGFVRGNRFNVYCGTRLGFSAKQPCSTSQTAHQSP